MNGDGENALAQPQTSPKDNDSSKSGTKAARLSSASSLSVDKQQAVNRLLNAGSSAASPASASVSPAQSSALDRVKAFLPKMAAANADLKPEMAGTLDLVEDVDDDEPAASDSDTDDSDWTDSDEEPISNQQTDNANTKDNTQQMVKMHLYFNYAGSGDEDTNEAEKETNEAKTNTDKTKLIEELG